MAHSKPELERSEVTMRRAHHDKAQLPFSYQLVAGAVAGVTEIIFMYPLDVVKTRLCVHAKNGPNECWAAKRDLQIQLQSASTLQYRGMIHCAQMVAQSEGISAFYRGMLAPIFMEAPKRATKFTANGAFGQFYRELFQQEMDQKLSILTGASAGIPEACVICPFEVLKLRMQNPTNAAQYKNIFQCCAQLARKEGPLIFFQGFESTLWRSVVFNAGYFGCIFQIRGLMNQSQTKFGQMANDLVAGSIGGTVGVLVNTPFDVVKSRIQSVQQTPRVTRKYNWAFPALATLYREEGFKALYKGLVPKIMRFCPGGGILLVVYTAVTDFMMAATAGSINKEARF